MSVRRTPTAAPAAAAPQQTSRLNEVLKLGLQNMTIDTRSSQAATVKQLRSRTGLEKTIKKEKAQPENIERLKQMVEALEREQGKVSFKENADVVEDCFEYIDSYVPCTVSTESIVLVISVGVVRLFEHNGLCNPKFCGEFYLAANTFLAQLDIMDELSFENDSPRGKSGASTGVNLFSDPQQGQARREVFADASLAEGMSSYFTAILNFKAMVQQRKVKEATEALIDFLVPLIQVSLRLGESLPIGFDPFANDILRRLSDAYGRARGVEPWLLSDFEKRAMWVEAASKQVSSRSYAGGLFKSVGGAVLKLFSGDLSGVREIQFPTATSALAESNLEKGLRYLWKFEMMSNPTKRIAFDLFFIVSRAFCQVTLYNVKSIETFAKLNNYKEALKWKKELDKAAKLTPGISRQEKNRRKTDTKRVAVRWSAAYKTLKKEIFKRPGGRKAKKFKFPRNWSSLTDLTSLFTAGDNVPLVRNVKIQIWRAKLKPKLEEFDQAIKQMRKLQTDYYDDNEMDIARRAIAADGGAGPAALGGAQAGGQGQGQALDDLSSEDDDEGGDDDGNDDDMLNLVGRIGPLGDSDDSADSEDDAGAGAGAPPLVVD